MTSTWAPGRSRRSARRASAGGVVRPLRGGAATKPTPQSWAPHADLSETDQAYVAEVELPGVAKDDISVELAGQELIISGELRASGSGTHGRGLRRGRRSGRFEYRVLLPGHAEADKVTAALADGVLTVTVPKSEADKPHRIPVTG